jgi:hypothetical protein
LTVFLNRVLRTIFGPRRDEVREEWRRLHNEELYVLYSSLNIIRVTKSRSGYAVAQLVEALRYKLKGRGFDSRWSHCGPGVDSASNRNEYQESFLGVKTAGA